MLELAFSAGVAVGVAIAVSWFAPSSRNPQPAANGDQENIINIMERAVTAIDELNAKFDTQSADIAAQSVAVNAAVAELGSETAKIRDLLAQIAAGSNDAAIRALADKLGASNAAIEAQTAALVAAVPAPAPDPAPITPDP